MLLAGKGPMVVGIILAGGITYVVAIWFIDKEIVRKVLSLARQCVS